MIPFHSYSLKAHKIEFGSKVHYRFCIRNEIMKVFCFGLIAALAMAILFPAANAPTSQSLTTYEIVSVSTITEAPAVNINSLSLGGISHRVNAISLSVRKVWNSVISYVGGESSVSDDMCMPGPDNAVDIIFKFSYSFDADQSMMIYLYLDPWTVYAYAQLMRDHLESRLLRLASVNHRRRNKNGKKAASKKALSTALVPYLAPKVRSYRCILPFPTLQTLLQESSFKHPTCKNQGLCAVAAKIVITLVAAVIASGGYLSSSSQKSTQIVVFEPAKASTKTKSSPSSNPFASSSSNPFLFGGSTDNSNAFAFGGFKSDSTTDSSNNPFAFGGFKRDSEDSSNPFGVSGSSSEASTRARSYKKKKSGKKSKSKRTTSVSVSWESIIESKVAIATNEMMNSKELDTEKKVRSYYRKTLSLKWHPDKNSDPDAEEIFKRITAKMEEKVAKINKLTSADTENQSEVKLLK